jgi:hypothetical protein
MTGSSSSDSLGAPGPVAVLAGFIGTVIAAGLIVLGLVLGHYSQPAPETVPMPKNGEVPLPAEPRDIPTPGVGDERVSPSPPPTTVPARPRLPARPTTPTPVRPPPPVTTPAPPRPPPPPGEAQEPDLLDVLRNTLDRLLP